MPHIDTTNLRRPDPSVGSQEELDQLASKAGYAMRSMAEALLKCRALGVSPEEVLKLAEGMFPSEKTTISSQ